MRTGRTEFRPVLAASLATPATGHHRCRVSRPDPASATDQVQALFGAYQWNDAETDAKLVTEPLNDVTGFKDRFFVYDADVRDVPVVVIKARRCHESTSPQRGEVARAARG